MLRILLRTNSNFNTFINYALTRNFSFTALSKYSNANNDEDIPVPEIIHGEPFKDRKSIFQAHLAPIFSEKQISLIRSKLLEDKKIATATHNIIAYRIRKEPNSNEILASYNDDGEIGAGAKMLILMKNFDVENVMVIVTRWFGGIQLGADRFKHINNCCRDILEKNGYIKNPVNNRKSRKKK